MFLTLEQVFGRIKSHSVYRIDIYADRNFLHEHFVPPQEVASLSQQERIAAVQRVRAVFSIEYASCLPKYISIASVLATL